MRKLTAVGVKNARPKTDRYGAPKRNEIAAGDGLYLVVQPSGAKAWMLRYRFNGRTRNLRLGNAGDDANDGLTLAAARARTAEARVTLERGIDPAGDGRQVTSGRDRIEVLLEQFVELHVRKKTRRSYTSSTEGMIKNWIMPAWRGRSIGEIRRRDVIELIEKVAAKYPIQGNRVLGVLTKFDAWLRNRDVIELSFTNGVKRPSPEVAREHVLDNAEIAALWRATEGNDPSHRAVRLLLLTGARRNECGRIAFSELDPDRREWVIPAARTKNKRPAVVPLTDLAWKILHQVPGVAGSDYVFTTNGRVPINDWAQVKERLSAAAGIDPASWRLHDLRRTTATNLQRLGVRVEVIEQALNHVSGTRAGIVSVYQRHDYLDEVRAGLQRWSDRIEEIASGAAGKVIKLR